VQIDLSCAKSVRVSIVIIMAIRRSHFNLRHKHQWQTWMICLSTSLRLNKAPLRTIGDGVRDATFSQSDSARDFHVFVACSQLLCWVDFCYEWLIQWVFFKMNTCRYKFSRFSHTSFPIRQLLVAAHSTILWLSILPVSVGKIMDGYRFLRLNLVQEIVK
jgi:hypothetical protein